MISRCQSYKPYNYILRYNDAAYSKLAFGPMWVDILSNILPLVPEAVWGGIMPRMKTEVRDVAPKLALFSAHDTTILPILATLGKDVWDGEEWAPYASMVVIELHQIQTANDAYPSGKAFRVVYNGLVLTEKIDGCQGGEELCDVAHLLNRLASFAVKERDCESSSFNNLESELVKNLLSTRQGVAITLLIGVFSGVAGGLLTFVYLTRRLPCCSDGRGRFNKAPSSVQNNDEVHGEVASGYGAADSSTRNSDTALGRSVIL